jgi:hypothetical protein
LSDDLQKMKDKTITIQRGLIPCLVILILIISLQGVFTQPARAQISDIVWEPPINISNSPDATSTDPFLLADPTGKAHLFWAEKKSSLPGNQPDTLMYSVWDGKNWSRPLDIFFSPESDGTPVVAYPRAVMDERGFIHLIWLAQPHFPRYALYYSSVHVSRSTEVQAWQPREVLADDLTGTKYSADLGYAPEMGLHVLYARVQQGASPPEERAVTYTNSKDFGKTWSDQKDIYKISDPQGGASDVRLLLEPPTNIYATWTRWDFSGNGQAIVFSRSLDQGYSWEAARAITNRIGNEYERDWNNMALLGPGQIVTMFEGGWRAYRHAMYSNDAGVTWSDPIDTFPWLIGENGTVEFARDSNGTLHLFIAQRVREGYEGRGDANLASLWHSVWQGGQRWSDPVFAGARVNLINPKMVITGGNRVVTAWYTQGGSEITVMVGKIQSAPYLAQETLPGYTPEATAMPVATATHTSTTDPYPTPGQNNFNSVLPEPSGTGDALVIGLVSSLALFLVVALVFKLRR